MEVIHDIDEKDKKCECGCMKSCIGREESEQLDIIPAKIRVIKNVRLKYACKACEGVESNGPTVITAQMPEQIIQKSIGTPGLIAHVLIAKFVDALPFYRQEKQFSRIGVKIPRATMCNWAQKIADSFDCFLQPKNDPSLQPKFDPPELKKINNYLLPQLCRSLRRCGLDRKELSDWSSRPQRRAGHKMHSNSFLLRFLKACNSSMNN